MKKKEENIYVSILKYTPLIGLTYLVNTFFKEDIDSFIENTPKIYFTIGLAFILIYSLTVLFFKKTKNKKTDLFISSDNDYNKKDISSGMILIIIIGAFAYYYLTNNFELNAIIITAILLSSTIKSHYSINKSANFKLINQHLHFNNGKENRVFNIDNIETIKISKDEIIIAGKNTNELIHFIKIKEDDFKEMKLWFNKRLPYIEITKFNL